MPIRNTSVSFFGLGSHSAAPLLYSYIEEHPEVVLPETQTKFFTDAKIFGRGVTWYESNFKNKKKGILGELAEDYLTSAQAAGLIARTYPNARLLAVIENPLISIKVDYIEAVKRGEITRQVSLLEFLKRNPEVLLRAHYGRQLGHYFAYYAPNDLMVLLSSDVQTDVVKVVKKVYEHLGLNPKYVPVPIRHLVVEEVDEKKKPGLIKRFFRYLRILFKRLRLVIKPPVVPPVTAAELARKMSIPADLEVKLKDYYRADVAELSDLLRRNLTVEWGFAEE